MRVWTGHCHNLQLLIGNRKCQRGLRFHASLTVPPCRISQSTVPTDGLSTYSGRCIEVDSPYKKKLSFCYISVPHCSPGEILLSGIQDTKTILLAQVLGTSNWQKKPKWPGFLVPKVEGQEGHWACHKARLCASHDGLYLPTLPSPAALPASVSILGFRVGVPTPGWRKQKFETVSR